MRAAEDGEQRFGLRGRLDRIFRWLGEERAVGDEDLHRQMTRFTYEHTSEVAQRPERSDENSRRGRLLFVVHGGKRGQYLRVRRNCHDIKDAELRT